MSVKIIYFVHGTTTDNLEHKATGWLPGKLSEKGIQQSLALKEKINMEEIDLVISSDLKRAVDSANNIFKGKLNTSKNEYHFFIKPPTSIII